MTSKKSVSPASPSLVRQPIVAILGHVDHGKTSLLDAIRHAHLAAREVGGITQSIGAYQAEYQGKKITFIDTPGHAAFREMRSRGAKVADLAVLVVAADDGVKPQTVESIKHLKEAAIPFVVAITKIDKSGVTEDIAKATLTEHEVFTDGYGGNVPAVGVSSKSGKGLDNLLENILLLSELEELPYQENVTLIAPIIEVQKDKNRGTTVSVVVKAGKIVIGQTLYTESASCRVKALYDDVGRPILHASPGEPCLILGFNTLPAIGEIVSSVPVSASVVAEVDVPQEEITTEESSGSLNIILRADTLGSLEAIKNSLSGEINIIFSGTGGILESDVLLASSTGSIIVGFSVKTAPIILKLAETEGVVVKSYRIIYELLEYLEKKVLRIMEPTIDEEELGTATVVKVFEINKDRVAGCHVDSGRLEQGDQVHVKKADGTTKEARIKSIRIGKEEVKKVETGKECGIMLFPNLDIGEKSVIISYKKIKTDEI